MRCRRCKQDFGSAPAYGVHTLMVERVGRRKMCPSVDELKQQGMSLYQGQWFFLSPEMTTQAKQEVQRD
jgi:hypothetical protein